MAEHQRCGTDGGHGTACLEVALDGCRQRLAGIEIRCTWKAARKHKHLCLMEVNIGELDVGCDAHAVRTHHNSFSCDRYRLHLHSGATHDVNWCQSLDVLEACG